jgi:hypothetical protein
MILHPKICQLSADSEKLKYNDVSVKLMLFVLNCIEFFMASQRGWQKLSSILILFKDRTVVL